MTAVYNALVQQGDAWLAQAQSTYVGGGNPGSAAAEASIAAAVFARAQLEKPDGIAQLAEVARKNLADKAAQDQTLEGYTEGRPPLPTDYHPEEPPL